MSYRSTKEYFANGENVSSRSGLWGNNEPRAEWNREIYKSEKRKNWKLVAWRKKKERRYFIQSSTTQFFVFQDFRLKSYKFNVRFKHSKLQHGSKLSSLSTGYSCHIHNTWELNSIWSIYRTCLRMHFWGNLWCVW